MVMMVMIMSAYVLMSMRVVMLMVAMVQPLTWTRAARVLTEHQRLDGHRHGI